MAYLEHINITVADPQKTADLFVKLFDWKIRWQGTAIYDGYTVHVGTEHTYIALYTPKRNIAETTNYSHQTIGLNHIGIVVKDLDIVENRVKKMGYETFNHASYEPGRRFYFHEPNRLEIEVVSYGK